MEFSKEFSALFALLPFYIECLNSSKYEQAIEILEAEAVSIAIENVNSPFIVLALTEKIFREMSFVGVKCDKSDQTLELSLVYVQILSDLYSLNKLLCQLYKSSRIGVVPVIDSQSESRKADSIDLSIGCKFLDGLCKLIGSRIVMVNAIRTLSDICIYADATSRVSQQLNEVNSSKYSAAVLKSLAKETSFFPVTNNSSHQTILGRIVTMLEASSNELSAFEFMGCPAFAILLKRASYEADALVGFIRLRCNLNCNSCFVDCVKGLKQFQFRIQSLQQLDQQYIAEPVENEDKSYLSLQLSTPNSGPGYPYLAWLSHACNWLKCSLQLRFEEISLKSNSPTSLNLKETNDTYDTTASCRVKKRLISNLIPSHAIDEFLSIASSIAEEVIISIVSSTSMNGISEERVLDRNTLDALSIDHQFQWILENCCPRRSQWKTCPTTPVLQQELSEDNVVGPTGRRKCRMRHSTRRATINRTDEGVISAATLEPNTARRDDAIVDMQEQSISISKSKCVWKPYCIRGNCRSKVSVPSTATPFDPASSVAPQVDKGLTVNGRTGSIRLSDSPHLVCPRPETPVCRSDSVGACAVIKGLEKIMKCSSGDCEIGTLLQVVIPTSGENASTALGSGASANSRQQRSLSNQSNTEVLTNAPSTPVATGIDDNVSFIDSSFALFQHHWQEENHMVIARYWPSIVDAIRKCAVACSTSEMLNENPLQAELSSICVDEEVAVCEPITASHHIPDNVLAVPSSRNQDNMSISKNLIAIPLGDSKGGMISTMTPLSRGKCTNPESYLICMYSIPENSDLTKQSQSRLMHIDKKMLHLLLQLKRSIRGDDLCFFRAMGEV